MIHSSGLAKNKKYASQSLRSTEPEVTLGLILMIKHGFYLNSYVGESEG